MLNNQLTIGYQSAKKRKHSWPQLVRIKQMDIPLREGDGDTFSVKTQFYLLGNGK